MSRIIGKYCKRPVAIDAAQWFENGDHPEDDVRLIDDGALGQFLSEGKVVRRFRHPDIPGDRICSKCQRSMHDHGWIDTLEDGHNVCPGDVIIKGVRGEFYPCKPDIFEETYEAVQ